LDGTKLLDQSLRLKLGSFEYFELDLALKINDQLLHCGVAPESGNSVDKYIA